MGRLTRSIALALAAFVAVVVVVLLAGSLLWPEFATATQKGLQSGRDGIVSLVEVVGLLLLLGMVGLFLWSISRSDEGMRVLPFETSDPQYRSIGDALAAELQQIIQTARRPDLPVRIDGLYTFVFRPTRDDPLKGIGDVGAGGAKIPLGGVLHALQALWPLGGPHRIITGSYQKYENGWRLIARVEGDNVLAVGVTGTKDDHASDRVRDLAYKLAWELREAAIGEDRAEQSKRKDRPSRSWEVLRNAQDCQLALLGYDMSRDVARLREALAFGLKTYTAQRDYGWSAALLAGVAGFYYDRHDLEKAEMLLRLALRIRQDAQIYQLLGVVLTARSRHGEAIEILEEGLGRYPKGEDAAWLGLFHAQAIVHRGMEAVDPARRRSDDERALEEYRRLRSEKVLSAFPLVGMAGALGRLGRTAEHAQLAKEIKAIPESVGTTYDRACRAAVVGDADSAFSLLRRALRERGTGIDPQWLRQDADLKFIADDTRFEPFLKEAQAATMDLPITLLNEIPRPIKVGAESAS